MKRHALYTLLLIITLVTAGISTSAQDEGDCSIQLGRISARLIQAQDAAGRGDTETALELLAEVEASIAAIRESCQATVEATPDEGTTTYTTPGSNVTFAYPANWNFEQHDRSTYAVATSQEALARFFETNPTFEPGEQAIGLMIGSASQVGGNDGDTLADIMAAYVDQLRQIGYTLDSREAVTLAGFEGRRLDFSSSGFESILLAAQVDTDMFVLLIGTTAVGQIAELEPVFLAVADSVTPPPVVAPEPIELTETYTLDETFTFSYPAEWVIGDTENIGGTNTIVLGSSEGVLDSFNSSEPVLRADSVAFAALVTNGEDMVGVFPEDMTFNDFVKSLEETVITDFVVEESIFLNYGDYRGAEITFSDRGFSAVMTVLELRRGEIYVLLFTLMPRGESEAARTLTRAITASVQFPPESRPLGEPRIIEE